MPFEHEAREWDRAELELLALLPRRLAAPIRKLHTPHLAGQVLDIISEELGKRLARAPAVDPDPENPTPCGFVHRQLVPVYRVREALDGMSANREFVRHLWNKTHETRKNDHINRHYADGGRFLPPEPTEIVPPATGPWFAFADRGLGCVSHLEAMNETVAFWVARNIVTYRTRGRVLYVTPGPSTITAAIETVAANDAKFRVHEVSVLGSHGRMADDAGEPVYECLTGRSYWMPVKGSFDAAVIHLAAAAGPGASRHRAHYDQTRSPENAPVDAGKQAHRIWIKTALTYIRRAFAFLKVGGVFVVYLPTGIRMADRYLVLPGMLRAIEGAVAALPINVLRRQEVVEVEPVRQPFVDQERCPWLLMVGRKTAAPMVTTERRS